MGMFVVTENVIKVMELAFTHGYVILSRNECIFCIITYVNQISKVSVQSSSYIEHISVGAYVHTYIHVYIYIYILVSSHLRHHTYHHTYRCDDTRGYIYNFDVLMMSTCARNM